MRNCGDCVLCCYFTSPPEIKKSEGEWCKYCIKIEGCSIYENRPESCKNFNCLWKKQVQIPESLRPDKCGVMFELPDYCKTYIGYIDPERPDIWREANIIALIQKILNVGHSVLIYRGILYNKIFFLSNGMTEIEVKQDLKNAFDEYKSEGRIVWL